MRIDTIAIDGFGRFHDRRLSPAPGLTVVRGPNEAGKTTLLAFTRAMLFGFETNAYPALRGGKRGGWLDVEMADGRKLRIERYGERGGRGRLRVIENDADLGRSRLAQLLQGVESNVYRNIFAFGLAELTRFETLGADEVAARIYGAGAGTGGVSGLRVEQELRGEMEGLFRPGGKNPLMNRILCDLEAIDAQLADRDLPQEYAEAGVRLGATIAQLAELDRERAELDAEQRRHQRVVDGWEAWLALLRAQEQRDGLGPVARFDDDILERLSALETRLAEAQHAVEITGTARERAQAAVDAAVIDAAALERREALEALVEARRSEVARAAERARAERAADEARTMVESALGNLGGDWTVERVERFDDSIAVKSALSGRHRVALATTEAALAGARTDQEAALGQAKDATERAAAAAARVVQLRESLAERPAPATRARSLREVEQLRAGIPEQQRIADERPEGDLEARRKALDERLAGARELRAAMAARAGAEELLPSARAMAESASAEANVRYAWPLVLAIGGVVAAVLLFLVDASVAIALLVGASGVLGGLALAWWLRRNTPASAAATRARLERTRDEAGTRIAELGPALGLGERPAEADLVRLDAQLDTERRGFERDEDRATRAAAAATEVQRLMEALRTVCAANGLPDLPSDQDVEAFSASIEADRRTEAQLAEATEREQQLQAEAEAAAERVQASSATLEERAAEATTVRDAWADWLEAHDLDRTLDPETALRLIDAVTAAKQAVGGLHTAEGRVAELAAEQERYDEQVRSLARELEPEMAEQDDVAGIAAALARRLADATAGARARDELTAALDRSAQAHDATVGTEAAVAAALDGFLAEAEAEGGAALRREVARARQAATLEAEMASARATLAALSGPGEALRSFEADLRGVDDITAVEATVSGIRVRLAESDRDRDELNQLAGQLRANRDEMEADAAATELRQQREDLLSQLRAAAERWTTLAVAHTLLKRSRGVYEEAHRPAVVEKAERLLEQWTDGRYRRIIAPLGEDIRGIERADGTAVELPGLSRGTSEQLYLALRFGLVEHFVETSGEPLPIVMDDILVNFDPGRAAHAARSIEELARTCQVIYFTCHETTPLRAEREETLERLAVSGRQG